MKMSKGHYNELQACIKHYLNDHPSTPRNYANGVFPRAAAVKDLWKRYRWDLYWHATATANAPWSGLRSRLAQYLSDDHIDTALRKIVEPIERNYDQWPVGDDQCLTRFEYDRLRKVI